MKRAVRFVYCIATTTITLFLPAQGKAEHPQLTDVSIGIQTSPASALVMVAKDEGCFEQHGLKVTLQQFTAGKFALQAFLGGSLDAVVSGEVPVLLAAVQGNKIRVVTQVVGKTIGEVRVVALRDGTEKSTAEYFKARKRTVATSFGGGPEYYTYTFLQSLNVGEKDVLLVSQKPEDMPAALAAGSVDAISIFDPFAYFAEKQLGTKAVTLPDPGIYHQFYLLSVSEPLAGNRKDVVENLLAALLDAASMITEDVPQAKKVVAGYTKLDGAALDRIWNDFEFRPVLKKELLKTWANEQEWLAAKRPGENELLDVATLVDDSFLKKVDPSLVQ